MTRTEWTFLICAHALAVVVTIDYWWRHGLRDWLADAWYAGGEPQDMHLEDVADLIDWGERRSYDPPGQPGWVEDDAQTLNWMHTLGQDDDPGRCTECDRLLYSKTCPWCAVPVPRISYDQPTPPRFVRTAPIAPGVYVPLSDDTATDLPRLGIGAQGEPATVRFPGMNTEPGQPYHPHAGPPAWKPAHPGALIPCRKQPPDWLDELFTLLPDWYRRPALEAA